MARGPLILDRYEPLGTAGAGGFGTVRIAWDPRIQRKVAIKTIELSETDALRAQLPGADAVGGHASTADRWHGVQPWNEYLAENEPAQPADHEFEPVTALAHLPGLDEARTAAMLQDARIVTVYDFEVRGQTAYLIMEYVEGLTLTRLLGDYGDYFTLDMAAAVFDAVAGALTVAHKAGVLHLDIKPDNIIINGEGQAKVTDFGLATLADASGAGTTGGGTIGYMPLEQMRRQPLDARTDEWSLAALTYEMLTGENPFRARSLEEAERVIENAELVLPSLCWDDIDDQIDDVIFYALDPEPDRRYASIADFAEELDKFLGDPKAGKSQLARIVAAELAPAEEPDDDEEDDGERESEADVPRQPGFFARFMSRRRKSQADYAVGDEVDVSSQEVRANETQKQPTPAREPLIERVPDKVKVGAGRLFGAVSSGFLTAFALTNLPFSASLFGAGSAYVIGAAVVVVTLAGFALPSVGALVSLLLFSAALLSCGHPLVALVVAVASIAWYFVAREGMAAANVALALPPASAIGAASAIPFAAGSALRLVPALATTALSALIALVLAATGSMTLVSWGAFDHWNFMNVDVTGNIVRLLGQRATWATIVGWLGAAAALSMLRTFSSRAIRMAGVAIAVACVLTGSLIFAGPSAELFITVIVVAAILLVAL